MGKIKIAVSSCLAGHNVRYDGGNKDNPIVHILCKNFDCVYICPESAIGLGIPRPPINIIKTKTGFEARGKTNPQLDITRQLRSYAQKTIAAHGELCGYIFKSRSPSCGVNSTPWKETGNNTEGFTSGIYSAEFQRLNPELPMIEEYQLGQPEILENFIRQVKRYSRTKYGK